MKRIMNILWLGAVLAASPVWGVYTRHWETSIPGADFGVIHGAEAADDSTVHCYTSGMVLTVTDYGSITDTLPTPFPAHRIIRCPGTGFCVTGNSSSLDSAETAAGHAGRIAALEQDGTLLWHHYLPYIPKAIALLQNGDIICAGDSADTGVLARYDAAGTEQWSRLTELENIVSIAPDTSGLVHYAGGYVHYSTDDTGMVLSRTVLGNDLAMGYLGAERCSYTRLLPSPEGGVARLGAMTRTVLNSTYDEVQMENIFIYPAGTGTPALWFGTDSRGETESYYATDFAWNRSRFLAIGREYSKMLVGSTYKKVLQPIILVSGSSSESYDYRYRVSDTNYKSRPAAVAALGDDGFMVFGTDHDGHFWMMKIAGGNPPSGIAPGAGPVIDRKQSALAPVRSFNLYGGAARSQGTGIIIEQDVNGNIVKQLRLK